MLKILNFVSLNVVSLSSEYQWLQKIIHNNLSVMNRLFTMHSWSRYIEVPIKVMKVGNLNLVRLPPTWSYSNQSPIARSRCEADVSRRRCDHLVRWSNHVFALFQFKIIYPFSFQHACPPFRSVIGYIDITSPSYIRFQSFNWQRR